MGDTGQQYDYNPRRSGVAVCAAFFGLCAVVLGREAALNDRALIINGRVELWAPAATTFYWVLSAASAAIGASSAFLVLHWVVYRQWIRVGPASLTVPTSRWWRNGTEVPYRDIQTMSVRFVIGDRFLDISHAGGRVSIAASMLSPKGVFEEIGERLATKVREAQSGKQQRAEPAAADTPAAAQRFWRGIGSAAAAGG